MSPTMCAYYRRNLQRAALFCWALSTASYAWAAPFVIATTPIPAFNLPVPVLAMAAAGALVGFAYGPPVESRRNLYLFVMANTMIGAWAVVLLPEFRGWTVSPVAQPPLAGVLAAAARFIVPILVEWIPSATRATLAGIKTALTAAVTPKEGEK